MTTTVSIDGGLEPIQNDLIMDASASVLPGVAGKTASPQPGDIPCETVEAFRAAMAGSLSENAAFDRELRKVMVAFAPLAKQVEVRGQRSEVEGQRSEVEGQRSEVEGQRSEVRGQTKEGNHHCLTADLEPRTSHLTADLGPRTSHLTADLGPRTTEIFVKPDDLGRAGVSSPAADGEDALSSEVLVAAGVQPAVVPATPSVEVVEKPVSVSSVDVVRAQAAVTPLTPAEVLVQAAEAVADTLLVTPGLLRGQGEVVIRLRPDVLEGTDVRIAVKGRQLEVVFQPQTQEMAVMIENCRMQITSHLAAKIAAFNVTVDVRKKKV